MIADVTLVRGRIAPGYPYVWRLNLTQGPQASTSTAVISSLLSADVAERSWVIETSGSVTLPTSRARTTYAGPYGETVTFGTAGGEYQITFTDLPKRSLVDVALTTTVVVGATTYTVSPIIALDKFDRISGMSGELAQQLLMTMTEEDEEYFEDMLNAGWNWPRVLRLLELLDARLAPTATIQGGGTLSVSSTYYVGLATATATEAANHIVVPRTGSVGTLYVDLSAAPGTSKSYTFTLRVNGVDTTITCAVTGATATAANDITHDVSVAAGDVLTLKSVPAGTPTIAVASFGLVYSS